MNANAYVLEWLKMVQLILKFENCESKSKQTKKSELANDREHTNSNLEMEVWMTESSSISWLNALNSKWIGILPIWIRFYARDILMQFPLNWIIIQIIFDNRICEMFVCLFFCCCWKSQKNKPTQKSNKQVTWTVCFRASGFEKFRYSIMPITICDCEIEAHTHIHTQLARKHIL